jgi:hypothetical protein
MQRPRLGVKLKRCAVVVRGFVLEPRRGALVMLGDVPRPRYHRWMASIFCEWFAGSLR